MTTEWPFEALQMRTRNPCFLKMEKLQTNGWSTCQHNSKGPNQVPCVLYFWWLCRLIKIWLHTNLKLLHTHSVSTIKRQTGENICNVEDRKRVPSLTTCCVLWALAPVEPSLNLPTTEQPWLILQALVWTLPPKTFPDPVSLALPVYHTLVCELQELLNLVTISLVFRVPGIQVVLSKCYIVELDWEEIQKVIFKILFLLLFHLFTKHQ